ncbi:MAG: Rrf2 family transcriptional regulator [Campylobacter sp.]|nr:Rrf2 family transcriptional regulator [Campylobacter sp.]MBR2157831.1 Rrf2 family transcriptional regulator [Campylobacter sp.]
MALLSTKGVYGLMAILEIAKASEISPISIKEISDRILVSKNYLEQILNGLRGAGLIESIKGKNGGYFLALSADKITFADVFKSMEKDFKMTNLKITNPNLEFFFKKYDEKLLNMLNEPISKFEEYKEESTKFLDFSI